MIGQTSIFAPETSLPLRQRVSVELVTCAYARHALETYHYLHRTRAGPQVNYAVYIDGQIDGVITYAYPMCVGTIDGVPTTQLLEFARLYLHQNIPHTASCAIGKTLKRVRDDWTRQRPDAAPIQLIVSWSDTTAHVGTVYKASNFKWLKRSPGGGGGRNTTGKRPNHGDLQNPKDCWVYRWKA